MKIKKELIAQITGKLSAYHTQRRKEQEIMVAQLINSLKVNHVISRMKTAAALGRIGDNQAVLPLIEALGDENLSDEQKDRIFVQLFGQLKTLAT